MPIRRLLRESAFQLARRDLASFIEDHEEELLVIFRDEMARLDDELPEENLFIDVKLVPLGETILKAVLRAITRFLTEEPTKDREQGEKVKIPVQERGDAPIKLKHTQR